MGKAQNAQIESASIGISDNGLLNLFITVQFENGSHGMVEGHHALYLPPSWKHHKQGSLFGHIVWCWLNATDAKSVAEMVGKVVRIETESEITSVPVRVGHVIKDDRWFCTGDICKQYSQVSA